MHRKVVFPFAAIVVSSLSAGGCNPLPWPESPLYPEHTNAPDWAPPSSIQELMEAVEGHYVHYDVVAYEEDTKQGPMRTFVISYGFVDYVIEDGELVEYDRFCHAEHRINSDMVTSSFSDAATQAILARRAVVDISQQDGQWHLWRPATPALIGIDGDPNQPLTTDRNDQNINDADGDGKPGVTVSLTIAGRMHAEIYIARREVFQSDVTLYSDGSLRGHVVDDSEQLVLGATMKRLDQPASPTQNPDPGLSPIFNIPAPKDLDTCDELMAHRDRLFPPTPSF